MSNALHDHGTTFKLCSEERHRLLTHGKPGETRGKVLARFREYTDDQGWCLCCWETLAVAPASAESDGSGGGDGRFALMWLRIGIVHNWNRWPQQALAAMTEEYRALVMTPAQDGGE